MSVSSSAPIALIAFLLFVQQSSAYEIDPAATLSDSPASLLGVNHIGLSVRDLDAALEFYFAATDFKLLWHEVVRNNNAAAPLFGYENIEYKVAVLGAPNMLFELTEFSHNRGLPVSKMPVQGPGMTHTCFQSPAHLSGYEKFSRAGAEMLSRGQGSVD